MPTYEFRCSQGHTFDRFIRKISDSPSELECPECGAVAVRQVSGGAGLVFKGSGFYLTDYGKNAHRKGGDAKVGGDAKGDAGGASPSEGGDTKSAEPKPADTKSTDAKPAEPSSKNAKGDGAKGGSTAPGATGSASPKPEK